MKQLIENHFKQSISVKEETCAQNSDQIVQVVEAMIKAFKGGQKVLIFGNGGSAADSQHWAAELIGRFQKERRALPAIALTTDTSALTALGNDYSYDFVFARQVEGLGQKDDIAIGISTSGNSPNVIQGIQRAQEQGLLTISLTGGDGGKLAQLTDISLIAPSKKTAHIQESHICIYHCICDLVEREF